MVDTPSPSPAITFQGRDHGEQFQFYFRQHWMRIFWPMLRTFLATLGVLLVGWSTLVFASVEDPSTRHLTIFVLAVCMLLVHFAFLLRFYRYFLYVIVVTDKRVHRIKKTLLTVDEHQSIDLWVLQDIHKSQRGVVQNVFGFGTVVLEAQETHMVVHYVPHISECYAKLTGLHERARARIAGEPPFRPQIS